MKRMQKDLLQVFRYGFAFDYLILYDSNSYRERIIKFWFAQGTTRSEPLEENSVRNSFSELGIVGGS
jgi:hypothetical protein